MSKWMNEAKVEEGVYVSAPYSSSTTMKGVRNQNNKHRKYPQIHQLIIHVIGNNFLE